MYSPFPDGERTWSCFAQVSPAYSADCGVGAEKHQWGQQTAGALRQPQTMRAEASSLGFLVSPRLTVLVVGM